MESGDEEITEDSSETDVSQVMEHKNPARSNASMMPCICKKCGKVFKQPGTLRAHMKSHRVDLPYSCSFCEKRYATLTGLKIHKRAHTGEKPYVCTECGKGFADSSVLKRHCLIHTDERPHKCTVCGKGFTLLHDLKNHLRTHTGEKPYMCSTCGKAFSRSFSLTCHRRIHLAENPYKCDHCGRTFKQITSFQNHQQTHVDKKHLHFQCTQCGRQFLYPSILQRHMRMHSFTRLLQCNECGKAFHQPGELEVHQLSHKEEYSYKCTHCEKAFTTSWHLMQHQQSHLVEQPFCCPKCTNQFCHEADLNAHLLMHSVECPYTYDEVDNSEKMLPNADGSLGEKTDAHETSQSDLGKMLEQEEEIIYDVKLELLPPPVLPKLDDLLKGVLSQLDLLSCYEEKLSLQKVLQVSFESLEGNKPKSLQDVPWYFLRKVMLSDSSAVCIKYPTNILDQSEGVECYGPSDSDIEDMFQSSAHSQMPWIHPLDVIVSVLHCSDSILQQELMTKMSACQFALPLLLPTGNNSCTFLLWALQSIVKKWYPEGTLGNFGFIEENIVVSKMPTFTFMRVGDSKIPKSKTLNDILSSEQLHQNFFIHREMECANIARKISNGLAEICWHLPGSSNSTNIFSKAFAVINLRGDAITMPQQVHFLSQVSSSIFFFLEDITEKEVQYFESFPKTNAHIFLILAPNANLHCSGETLKKVMQTLQLTRKHIIIKSQDINDSEFTSLMRMKISHALQQAELQQTVLCLEDMTSTASQLKIKIDEDDEHIQRTRTESDEILILMKSGITENSKQSNFKFQGEAWQVLSNIEKEQTRLKKCCESIELRIRELEAQKENLIKSLLQSGISNVMQKFIKKLIDLPKNERKLLLQWMKLKLDSSSRNTLSALRYQYKVAYEMLYTAEEQADKVVLQNELKMLEVKSQNCSQGLEHFMREVGQIYEIVNTQKNKASTILPYDSLPHVAAEMLLDGIPLELVNGDALNMSTNWVLAVLKSVAFLIGNDKQLSVLSVLGAQSPGKSSFLNTMFGLQFGVGGGRSTKGAFLQLIEIKGSLGVQVGCDFLLVIDIGGLRSLEVLGSCDSCASDVELATLVIALSNVTLLYMPTEDFSEISDIFHILIRAFIRVKEVGKKPIYWCVHSECGDLPSLNWNPRTCKQLTDKLDEITRDGARMEGCEAKFKKFCDVVEYNPNGYKDYVSGIWLESGPMASVDVSYSTRVNEHKKYFFQTLKTCKNQDLTFSKFCKWLQDTWSALRTGNFIFYFRNSLAAEAYHCLASDYASHDWDMRREVHEWLLNVETGTITGEHNKNDLLETLNSELKVLITEKKTSALENLNRRCCKYNFAASFFEEYRAKFEKSIDVLGKNLEQSALQKCKKIIDPQNGLQVTLRRNAQQEFERRIFQVLEICRQNNIMLTDDNLRYHINEVWTSVTDPVIPLQSEIINIEADMEQKLKENSSELAVLGNFRIKEENIRNTETFSGMTDIFCRFQEGNALSRFKAEQLHNQCQRFINGIMIRERDYDPSYWTEILNYVNESIQHLQTGRFSFTNSFISNFTLHLCTSAVAKFQEMHHKCNEKNDPVKRRECKKTHLFLLFKELCDTNDASQILAELLCESSLKPAVMNAIEGRLGWDIVHDMKKHCSHGEFNTRAGLQLAVMIHLKNREKFEDYFEYISNSSYYEKKWLEQQVIQHCNQLCSGQTRLVNLGENILNSLICNIKNAINECRSQCRTINEFCKQLKWNIRDSLILLPEIIDVETFSSKSDFQYFVKCLQDHVDRLRIHVQNVIKTWRTDTRIESLPICLLEELYKSVAGCEKYCFWCSAPCDCADYNHSTHYTSYHRPVGLNGERWPGTQKLVADICTTLVTTDQCFHNKDTNWEWVSFSNYQAVNMDYRAWCIPADASLNGSIYWKAVLHRYNNHFAEMYSCLPAEIPSENYVPWSDICKDIDGAYTL